MADADLARLIDVGALERFVNATVPGVPGPLSVQKHVAGFSNETFYVSRGEERWVLRRPPRGPLLPTAHDVVREHRFLSALHGKARVPRPVALCQDTSVIGAPFYLMERMEGVVVRTELPSAYDDPAGRYRMAEEMVDTLAEIHAVDWRAAGLAGRDSGYVVRQVERWSNQWELTKPRTRELPGLDRITAWLKERIPAEVPATVVHGDYKLDNVMFAVDQPRLVAVFDWEMATIGDPLADLGYLLNTWTNPPSPPGFEDRPPLRSGLSELAGFPSVGEMAALYEARTGRSMRDFLFYRVLAAYKGIVILEGLYMHFVEGAAANPGAAEFEWRVPMMIASAQRLIDAKGDDVR
ncbi:MAG: phosphotransferase family protein [Dehalococcoidia bacterium]|nr:phosphotransferase family protein [Dehalococcoidia bacterium]